MRTKMKVRRNDNPTPAEMEYRRAIHILQDACNDQLILMHDEERDVYIIPAILSKDCSESKKEGTVEYQVSDGLPGERGNSNDFYHLEEAVKRFQEIQVNGWGFKARPLIHDLCEKYNNTWGIPHWGRNRLWDLLRDLPARGKYTKVPKRLFNQDMYEIVDWLVHHCEPSFTTNQVEDYLVNCMQP